MTDVVIEKKGHVAIVKIEHMKAMNALSTDMYAQLEEAFDELAKDLDNVYAVVLTGSSTVNKKGKTVTKTRTVLAHTLNNTCVAPPRMLIAFLENHLQADGSVTIPEVLRPYMGGKAVLVPNKK